jgi:aspartate 1-decarboxylase
MQRNMLRAKLHRARVTECDIDYEGSITIDRALIEAGGFLPYEQVDIYNISNGNRLTSYIIEGVRDSGVIGLNGAAVRLCDVDDLVIICAYFQLDEEQARRHQPVVLSLNPDNTVRKGGE